MMIAIAGTSGLLAIQNVDRVSITLLGFQSIQIPFGLALTACAALGAIGTALGLTLSRGSARQR